MSRFKKLAHAFWHCQYLIVWVQKYRLRILTGQAGNEIRRCIGAFSEHLKCEVVELNIQCGHVHLIVMIPPKLEVSNYMGTVKGRALIRVLNKFRHLKQKP